MARRFLVALHFEANVEIEAEDEEQAIGKGFEQLNERHVFKDADIRELGRRCYDAGVYSRVIPVLENPAKSEEYICSIADEDYVCDNDPVILEEIK